MTGSLVLGIDGGGSKTLIALADRDGTVVATSGGSGINPMDRPDWRGALDAMLAPYRERLPEIGAVVAGLPAYGELPPLSAEQERAIAAFFGERPQRVVNDVEAAHIGAFAGGPGVLILSGTGSMAWARDAAGHSLRVGGFGEAIGDEGSAHWIGIEAIARASRAMDGRIDAPDFLAAFLAHLGLDPASPQDGLIAWRASVEHARSEIAALARLVDTLAERALPWSTAGGSFASRLLRERTAARIGSEPLPPRLPPIGGALLGAARDLDWPVDEAWIGRLAASIENNAIHARNGRTPSPRRDDQ